MFKWRALPCIFQYIYIVASHFLYIQAHCPSYDLDMWLLYILHIIYKDCHHYHRYDLGMWLLHILHIQPTVIIMTWTRDCYISFICKSTVIIITLICDRYMSETIWNNWSNFISTRHDTGYMLHWNIIHKSTGVTWNMGPYKLTRLPGHPNLNLNFNLIKYNKYTIIAIAILITLKWSYYNSFTYQEHINLQ